MIIGLIGKKGSGKSTCAEYLVREHQFTEYTLAGPIKDIARIFGFTDRDVNGTQEEKLRINECTGMCARSFMQIFGTEFGRDIVPTLFPDLKLNGTGSIWIKLMQDFIAKHPDENIVVSDIRFPDEVKGLEECGVDVVFTNIVRPSLKEDAYTSHSSETAMDGASTFPIIYNDGDFEHLYKQLQSYIKE